MKEAEQNNRLNSNKSVPTREQEWGQKGQNKHAVTLSIYTQLQLKP